MKTCSRKIRSDSAHASPRLHANRPKEPISGKKKRTIEHLQYPRATYTYAYILYSGRVKSSSNTRYIQAVIIEKGAALVLCVYIHIYIYMQLLIANRDISLKTSSLARDISGSMPRARVLKTSDARFGTNIETACSRRERNELLHNELARHRQIDAPPPPRTYFLSHTRRCRCVGARIFSFDCVNQIRGHRNPSHYIYINILPRATF